MAKKKVLFHQDNVPVHKSAVALAEINELKSQDLAPLDYFLSRSHKNIAQWSRTLQRRRSNIGSKWLIRGANQLLLQRGYLAYCAKVYRAARKVCCKINVFKKCVICLCRSGNSRTTLVEVLLHFQSEPLV